VIGADRVVHWDMLVAPAGPCALMVRHGLTFWNAEQRWQGSADIELHPDGISQAVRAAKRLGGMSVDRVVSSNLIRAVRTAEELSSGLTVSQPGVSIDNRFAERDIGEWSGLLTEEIEHKWPGRLDAWRRGEAVIPGGEDEALLEARVMSGLLSVLESVSAQTTPVAVVVTHGGVMRTIDRLTAANERPVRNLDARWFSLVDDVIMPGDVVSLAQDGRIAASEAARGTSL
jgi:glucosyl-3-phosphoglycerate phosphatase